MPPLKTLSYKDLLNEQHCRSIAADHTHTIAQHECWGTLEIKQLHTDNALISYYNGDLNEALSISFEDKHLADVVNICISLEGQTEAFSKDHHLRLPLSANQYHHVTMNDDGYDLQVAPVFKDVHIQFNMAYFKDLLCNEHPWMSSLKNRLENKSHVLEDKGTVTYEMMNIIQSLFNNPLTGQLKKIYTEGKVLELLATQLKQLSEISVTGPKPPTDRDLFMAIHEYLQQHFTEDLSLSAISRHFGINEFKLKKGYKENFSSTVFDHILELRMKKAYELLQEGNCFVHEVSRDIGYKSANHFATAFKKRFGKSPSAL